MGIFYIKKNQQAVQGFPVNRSYTKSEADAKFSGGSGITFETPTGTVNGTNVTFTVTNVPKFIIVDGVSYFEGQGYSRATLTLTTDIAPAGFIRSAY